MGKLTNAEPSLVSLPRQPKRGYSTALINPGLVTRQLETPPTNQRPLKLFPFAHLNLFTLPCLAFPGLSTLLASHWHRSLPIWHWVMCVPPGSKTCENSKLSFPETLLCLLLGLQLTDHPVKAHRTLTCSQPGKCAELRDYQVPEATTTPSRV